MPGSTGGTTRITQTSHEEKTIKNFDEFIDVFKEVDGSYAIVAIKKNENKLYLAKNKSPENLLLSGVIAGTVATSVLMYLVSTASSEDLAGITWWMLGDLQSVDSDLLIFQSCYAVLAVLLVQFFAKDINCFF